MYDETLSFDLDMGAWSLRPM